MKLRVSYAVIVLAACGPAGRGGSSSSTPGLQITPASVTLTVTAGQAAQQQYSVIDVADDGSQTDVTADTTLTIVNPTLGTFAGAMFTSSTTLGGHTHVTAAWNGEMATADLTVLMRQTIVEPGAPGNATQLFGGAQAGGPALTLIYPQSGVIVPPNMGSLEFQYMPDASQNLFELTITGSALQLAVYFPCTALATGCVWTPTAQEWNILATAGRNDAPMTYALRGLDQTSPSPVAGTSGTNSLQFAADDLVGGIYYWAASAGAIMRYDFGHPGSAETYLKVSQTTGLECVGCHALSRDGSQIAVGLDIPGPAALEDYTVATTTRDWTTNTGGIPGFPSANGANFFSFSPDNARIVSSGGTNLVVRSATDGTGMTTIVQNATMPDWSPDGLNVVFSRPGQATVGSNPGVSEGSIVAVDAATWGTQRVLVAGGNADNNYYPSWSPDGAWIAFNKTANSDSYDQPDARVWVVSASGGAPIQLATASPTGGDSWPKWSTEPHAYVSGTIFWLTFSSRRAYGLRGDMDSQIWMVGIDPARAAAGMDPSFAAFWFPFQDFTSGNHIAQWVEKIDRQMCPCPTGEFCSGGVCYPNIQ